MTPAASSSGRSRAGLLTLLLLAVQVAALCLAGAGSAANSTDLKVSKVDSPDPVFAGSTLNYTITVEDLGPLAATGVKVVDQLPKGVDFVAATASVGQCVRQARKVTCDLGGLGPGIGYGGPATVKISVVPRQPGTISNTASVKGEQKDPAASNNKATATTQVLAAPACRGAPATIVGTPGNDVLAGTGGSDVIVALGGDDRIFSLAGPDLICAGSGNDRIGAGTAADRVFAGAGSDRLLGRGGPDLLAGAAGNDVLAGGRGSDRLRGGRGFDVCRGGAGSDSIRGCERPRNRAGTSGGA